jgi:hypothetical protein
MMRSVDLAYYEEISGLLRGLLIRLEDRLPAEAVAQTSEFIDVNELGLALELMADALSEAGQAITAAERADMLSLVDRMKMGPKLQRALELCPEP